MAATRRACAALGRPLDELPAWYDVAEPSDLVRLSREVGERSDRAPRTMKVLHELFR